MANCIIYKAQAESWDPISISEINKVFYITMGFMIAEITVSPDGSNGSIIELRSLNAPIKIYINQMKEFINSCASLNPKTTPAQ